jgi:hypothetical protein
MQPLQGQIENLPPGQVRVALFGGSTVDLPLPRIQFLQRDLTAGSIRIVLDDEQTFAGKLVSLPDVGIPLGPDRDSPSVPLSRIAVMERTPPGGRLF